MKFFVYGTLKQGGHFAKNFDGVRISSQDGIILNKNMHNLGGFPGIVEGTGVVEGEMHDYSNEDFVMYAMDEIERYYEDDPENSLYKREIQRIYLDDGTWEDCWVYLYNCPINHQHTKIDSGVWKVRETV